MKDFELIYASQLRAKQRESRALVIDIRDRKEYESEHWPGAARTPTRSCSGLSPKPATTD